MRLPNGVYRVPARLKALFGRARADRELDDELRDHVEQKIAAYVASGLAPEDARRRALIELGGLEQAKEKCRDARGLRWLHDLAQDLCFGARLLRKSPGFTTVAVLTLALGIGANTAMFSVVNGVLLRPLPFQDASRIVRIGYSIELPPDRTKTLTDICAYEPGELNFSGAGEPASVAASQVTLHFFDLFGVRPVLGRSFSAAEESAVQPYVAALSYDFWRAHFHADPHEIGQIIELNGSPLTVVGIMPPGFHFPGQTDVWTTSRLIVDKSAILQGYLFGGNGIVTYELARLRPSATLGDARAELEVMRARQPSEQSAHESPTVTPLHETMISEVRGALLLLLGAAGMVLLIACANLANLILARGASRAREFALRSAIGGSRARLLRQVMAESILLSAIGGGLGIMLGGWAVLTARSWLHGFVPLADSIHLDSRVLAVSVGAVILAAMLTGIVPALQFSHPDLNVRLKESGGTAGAGAASSSRPPLPRLFCIAEIAASVLLLAGAGLLLRSFSELIAVNPGFRTEHLVAARVDLLSPDYESAAARLAFIKSILDRTRALPGVQDAALASGLPLAPGVVTLFATKRVGAPDAESIPAVFMAVSPGYFRTLGIPLLAGRDFTDTDRWFPERPEEHIYAFSGPPGSDQSADRSPAGEGNPNRGSHRPAPKDAVRTTAAILSRSLAVRLWPGQDPVGKQVDFAGEPITVVGTSGDVHDLGLDENPVPAVYLPIFEQPQGAFLAVRSEQGTASLASALRSVVASGDKDEPISRIMTMDGLLAHSTADARSRAALLGLFAALAFGLAVIGIYGVVSYAVAQRTHEIGVRMALGAQRADVRRLILGQGAWLALFGIALGLAGAFGLTRFLRGMLFGVTPTDPATFAAVALLLFGTALAASYVPARRAMKVDPMTALRHE